MRTENSKAYFNAVAGDWDNMRKGFFSEKVREKAMALANIVKGDLVADIGAGTGFMTEGLIEKEIFVIAVDQSLAMLREMEKKFYGYFTIDYRFGEAEEIPIGDGEVDYAFANMYLHHTDNPAAAIREMARIVKKGGKLIITDLDEHAREFLRTEQHDRWLGFKRSDIKKWFEAAGLKNVSVQCVDDSCCTCSDSGDEVKLSIFVASGEK